MRGYSVETQDYQGQALKGARCARSLDSPEFPRWMKISDGERSATVAPAQEAGRILLAERF